MAPAATASGDAVGGPVRLAVDLSDIGAVAQALSIESETNAVAACRRKRLEDGKFMNRTCTIP